MLSLKSGTPTFQLALDRQMKKLARRGVTQKDIVRITGIRLQLLRAWRRGERWPNHASFGKLQRLAILCQLPMEYFVIRVCRDRGWAPPSMPATAEEEQLEMQAAAEAADPEVQESSEGEAP